MDPVTGAVVIAGLHTIGRPTAKALTSITKPTRFGTRERLQRCTAIMRANRFDIYLDIVMHQWDGGNDFTYSYPGANSHGGAGRLPKHKTCFVPNVPRDPIAGPVSDDFAFGDELAPLIKLAVTWTSTQTL
jgi:hypothetical protein